MGYRIEYDRVGGRLEITQRNQLRFPLLVITSLGLIFLLTLFFWPQGAAYLREAMVPGDNEQTLRALAILATDLRSGAGLGEAVESFCSLVIYGPQG